MKKTKKISHWKQAEKNKKFFQSKKFKMIEKKVEELYKPPKYLGQKSMWEYQE